VTPVDVDGGVVGELRVGSGQQRLGSLQGQRLVGFEDQQVVRVQLPGNQTGGLLRRVQGVLFRPLRYAGLLDGTACSDWSGGHWVGWLSSLVGVIDRLLIC
jgi:hypothetical protein